MARSQRVLSGSLTRGSTATPSGSIIFLYQGVNAKTNESYFGSLLPRIGSGDRLALYRHGKRLPQKTFDDSITMNSDPADIRGEGDDPISTRIDFRYESRNFGQLDQRPEGYSFIETREYDAVGYLQDPGTTMWPVNLFNASLLPKYEYDGVIEPLDIRAEMLGILDTRYEGHSVRGALMGAVGEGPLGSRRIKETWFKYEPPAPWFLDAPDSFGHGRIAGSVPWDPNSYNYANNEGAMPLQAFQNLDQGQDYPFVERDYQNEVYAGVTSHNPGTFIPVSTPTNWNYVLTSSFQTANDTLGAGYQYLSADSLVIWHRYERAIPSTTNNPGAGGFLDSSSHQYTGSLYYTDAPVLVPSIYPSPYIGTGSWSFDGNDTYEYIGGKHVAGGTLDDVFCQRDFFHKPWTFSFWIYQNAVSYNSRQVLLFFGSVNNSETNSLRVSIDDGRFWIKNIGATAADYTRQYTSAALWSAEEWVHIVVQQFQGIGLTPAQGGPWRVYVNGVEKSWSNTTIAGTKLDAFNGLKGDNFITIGGSAAAFGAPAIAYDFNGYMAEFAAWDSVLSEDEVSALYDVKAAGIKSVLPSLVAYTLKTVSVKKPAWRAVYGGGEYNAVGKGLVGWWRLGLEDKGTAGAGTVLDAAGNWNAGTQHNLSWSVATKPAYIGDPNDGSNYVPSFSGTNSYVILNMTAQTKTIVGLANVTDVLPFTMAVWIKPDTYAANEPIWFIGDGTDGKSPELQFNGSGNLRIRWANLGWISASSSSSLIHDGDWHHVVVTQRAMPFALEDDSSPALVNATSRYRLYIDGELIPWTSGNFTTPYGDPIGYPILIGINATGNKLYDGKMIELSLWSTELDQQTIRALYNVQSAGVRQYSLGGTVYSSVVTEQNNDMTTALQLLNSSSYRNSSDPLETRAHHGFYFGQKAGSITYGDI